jgi:hypothetical protein
MRRPRGYRRCTYLADLVGAILAIAGGNAERFGGMHDSVWPRTAPKHLPEILPRREVGMGTPLRRSQNLIRKSG